MTADIRAWRPVNAPRRSAIGRHLVVAWSLFFFLCLPQFALRTGAAQPHGGEGAPIVPDLERISDGKAWQVINGEFHLSNEGGKPTVRLSPIGGNRQGSNVAMALVRGVAFAQGQIEVDLRGDAAGQASFLGVAFGVTDGHHAHEAIYFRPFNFQADNPVNRAHAVQYVAWPQHTWDRLRAERPGAYEAAVAPVPDPAAWFHSRIEVSASRVRVFVNDAAQPCLSVDRLGGHAAGDVGLWVDSQPGSFANLKIQRGL